MMGLINPSINDDWNNVNISISWTGTSTYCGQQYNYYNVDITGSIPSEFEAYEIISDYGCVITNSACDADANGHCTGCLELQVTGTSGFGVVVWALDENGQRYSFKEVEWPSC
jgi:hypothetical protein